MKRSDFYVSTLGHRFVLGSDLSFAEWGRLQDLLNPRLAYCCSLNEANAVLDQFFKVIETPEVTEVTLMIPVTFYIENNILYSRDIVSYNRFVGAAFNDLGNPSLLYGDIRKACCRNAKDALRYLATRPERSCTSPGSRSE